MGKTNNYSHMATMKMTKKSARVAQIATIIHHRWTVESRIAERRNIDTTQRQ